MINSATALRQLKSSAICTMIADEEHGVVGYGIYTADLKLWMAQKGFRIDTNRSTFVRWTETWTMTGQMIPIQKGANAIAYWFAEVPKNIAIGVAQYGDQENVQTIYALDSGLASKKILKSIGISWGGLF